MKQLIAVTLTLVSLTALASPQEKKEVFITPSDSVPSIVIESDYIDACGAKIAEMSKALEGRGKIILRKQDCVRKFNPGPYEPNFTGVIYFY